MKKVLIIAAAVLLAGCESTWVQEQHDRCRVMGGTGAYAEKKFECWQVQRKPFSLKLEFNKDVGYQQLPPRKLLYELKYGQT